ncbi:MAG: FtsQ-type POTRA domain-containing protein [Terracidiphilus sp.]
MQPVAPRAGRTLPGMPPEFDDPEADGEPRLGRRRFGQDRGEKQRGRWWLPTSTPERAFLAAGVLLVLGGFLTASLTLKRYLERDARFRVAGSENIQASGLGEVTRAQLLPVFGEDIGRNVFFVPLNERRKQLEQIPWVERATVMRLLPDQIRVSVVERKPVAFTRHGQQIGLVDANGVLLKMAPATMAARHYSFPVVTGIDPGDPADARKERMAMYLRMMSELDADGKRNSEQISEIDLTDPEDARVLMPEQGTDILAHFGEDHFLERYQRFQEHIAEWQQQYPHLAAVDLRYDNQVVLDMASGKETAETATGNDAKSGVMAGDSSAAGDRTKTAAGAPAARKSKPAQAKKHGAARRAALNTTRSNSTRFNANGRNPGATTRPAAVQTATANEQGG